VTHRRFLYLGPHRLAAYAWRQGSLLVEGVFDSGDEGLAAFGDYLAERRDSHFALLANVAEEEHTQETIPYLQGRDRQILIARKIGQHFLGSPLAAAVSLGYEKTRRKNEKLLLSALTKPAHFEPWLRRIAEAEAPLAGLYTIAQLGGQLPRRLGIKQKACMLLTMQDHSIRESYLSGDRALFSRMVPLTDSSIAGIAASFAAEAGKLQQYLIGQRLVGRDDHLPVLVVAHPAAIPAVTKACPDHGNLSFTFIDSHAAALRLGLKTLPDDNRCDLLYLQLLATHPPRQQFASDELRHDYQVARWRRGILAAGLLMLAAGLLFAAHEFYNGYTLRQETRTLQAGEREQQARYDEIAATFPQMDVDNDTLRRLADRYGELRRQQRQPAEALRLLSRALDQMPAIALDHVAWRLGRRTPEKPGGQDASASLDGDEEITVARGRIQLAPNASIRQNLAAFDRFVDLLRADPGSSVRILQQPHDMESGSPLRGGGDSAEQGQPPFAVEITRTLAP